MRKLQSKEIFIDDIKTVQKSGDYKLVYFDVNSLFINVIPLQLALHCSDTAIQQPTVKLPLPTEHDIMDLLALRRLTFSTTVNNTNSCMAWKSHVRSPFSVVAKEIVMQKVDERALTTCRQTVPLW